MAIAPSSLKSLLKDQWFNAETLCLLSEPLAKYMSTFDAESFTQQVLAGFSERELSERICWVRTHLRKFLPADYREAVVLILRALPEPCDPELSDGDFGHFIYEVYGDFVAYYGCSIQHLYFSLQALKAITTRFSAEFAVRPFLLVYPEETLEQLSLRSLIKQGHGGALQRMGYDPHALFSVEELSFSVNVNVGEFFYTGCHGFALQINGKQTKCYSFELHDILN